MPLDPELWTETVRELVSSVALWLPRLLAGLLWLLIGWVVAHLFQAINAGGLRRLGFDRIVERAGVRKMLADAGLDPSASRALARIVYWLILPAPDPPLRPADERDEQHDDCRRAGPAFLPAGLAWPDLKKGGYRYAHQLWGPSGLKE